MATKTGEMRESLMDAIESVKAGKLTAGDAGAIAKLAAQISLSMQVEANIRSAAVGAEARVKFGELPIGEQPAAIEA